MKYSRLAWLLLLFFLWIPIPVQAQNETLPTRTITGQLLNQTPGGIIPEGLPGMMHAWDKDFNEKLMLEGQANAAGTFLFEAVPFDPTWLYAIMLTYQDVLYFSDPVLLAEEQTSLTLTVPVYETTTDTAAVRIARQHIFFDAASDGLLIGEVYVLSNLGDRTIVGQPGEDTLIAPLLFSLPEDATNVVFEENQDGRFRQMPGGFVDTAPLRPGTGSSQVVVKYSVPYAEGRAYTMMPSWPVEGITFLLPTRIGLALAGEGLVDEGVRDMGDGGQIAVYSYEGLATGNPVTVNLSGVIIPPIVAPAGEMVPPETSMPTSANNLLLLGGGLLGLAFILAAVWWQRQTGKQVEMAGMTSPPIADSFDEMVTQIARLDEAHARGEMSDETYELRRAGLRYQAQQALQLANQA